MSKTEYPGFPIVIAKFGKEYLQTAVPFIIYFAIFSLITVLILLQTIPVFLILIAASVVSYALHAAAFEIRDTTDDDSTTLSDNFADDNFTDFVALVVALFVGFTAIYLVSLMAALLIIGITGSIYAGILVAMYLPVFDYLGNQTRWYLSVQALTIVAYLAIIHSLGILTRVSRSSIERFFPGYRFDGRKNPRQTSTMLRR